MSLDRITQVFPDGLAELDSLYGSGAVALAVVDRELRYVRVSEALAEISGRVSDDHFGCSVREVMPDLADSIEVHCREVLRNGQTALNIRTIAPAASDASGETGPATDQTYLVSYYPLRDSRDEICGVSLVFVDVTAEARAETAMAAAMADIQQLKDRLHAENVYLREEINQHHPFSEIVGQSAALREVLEQVEQVAATEATVLLLGETGTGKELLARAVHDRSARRDRLMVKVNCAALPAPLIEAELFGREKGAYTGALTRQAGRFELAHGSTLFLDEVSELAPEAQSKLLRVLQEGQFERLGSGQTLRSDARVIVATNRDLAKAVAEGRFRDDLFYRLNVFPIRVPPLRERRGDVPQLVWASVKEFGEKMGKSVTSIPRETMEAMEKYPWPGNVRELRNVIERAMILNRGSVLEIELPQGRGGEHDQVHGSDATVAAPAAHGEDDETLDGIQRRHIVRILAQTNHRVRGPRGAAELLGIKPTTLEARMLRLGISRVT